MTGDSRQLLKCLTGLDSDIQSSQLLIVVLNYLRFHEGGSVHVQISLALEILSLLQMLQCEESYLVQILNIFVTVDISAGESGSVMGLQHTNPSSCGDDGGGM